MRRHVMVFRSMKRRFRLVRPKYSLRVLWYGGTTFTMLLFTLLLVTSGLMYFYFQKCRVQEAELSKWRAGIKVETPSADDGEGVSGRVKRVVTAVEQSIRNMPSPSGARSEVASKAAETKQPETVKAGESSVLKQVAKAADADAEGSAAVEKPAVVADKATATAEKATATAGKPSLDSAPAITKATPEAKRGLDPASGRTPRPQLAQAEEAEQRWARAIEESNSEKPGKVVSAYNEESQPRSQPSGDKVEVRMPRKTAPAARRAPQTASEDPIGSYLLAR